MVSIRTLQDLLAVGRGDSAAVTAPGTQALTYDAFRKLVADTVATLNGFGIGRNDRVAIVLPNGPEMATSFVAIATGATAAPLNPAYKADEFEFYMSDLGTKALVVEAGSKSAALDAARKLGITVLTLTPEPSAGAGAFALSGGEKKAAANAGYAGTDDVALILHTSGTTSRPKIVPLSQGNVAASAQNIATALEFSDSDRGLNIMPLFHIHGLIAGLLAPLSRGSQVFCTPGFNALKFFAWMEESKPTWYTAVPTMHQAILSRAKQQQRNDRALSAALPSLLVGIHATAIDWRTRSRVPCTVDRSLWHDRSVAPDGLEPAARRTQARRCRSARRPRDRDHDEDGSLLGIGEIGEVVIRGDNVTKGYENNPSANASAFTNGWFRTGDQGMIDSDGHLSLTGRLKEIINRAGEKISPREVDEALLDHPAVGQVVTFAMPHDKLGEEVAAAVVLREGEDGDRKRIARLSFDAPRRFQDAAQNHLP